jgi:NitT/TauT family transport system permease protein
MTEDKFYQPIPSNQIKAYQVNISPLKRFLNSDIFLRLLILIAVILMWQGLAIFIHTKVYNGELLFPTITDTFKELGRLLITKQFLNQMILTVVILAVCSLIGIIFGFLFAAFSISTRIGYNFLELVAPPMSSLPAVALISAAILAFSSNLSSMIFVVSNAVFWTVLASTHAGFTHVPETLRRVGQNYGLSAFNFVRFILFPAALPSILMGIRLGISRAFQAFVAVELVIGSVYNDEHLGLNGALGFFIAEAKNNYQPPLVYAGLFAIMLISYVLDNQLFGFIERKTIVKWGMKSV